MQAAQAVMGGSQKDEDEEDEKEVGVEDLLALDPSARDAKIANISTSSSQTVLFPY